MGGGGRNPSDRLELSKEVWASDKDVARQCSRQEPEDSPGITYVVDRPHKVDQTSYSPVQYHAWAVRTGQWGPAFMRAASTCKDDERTGIMVAFTTGRKRRKENSTSDAYPSQNPVVGWTLAYYRQVHVCTVP